MVYINIARKDSLEDDFGITSVSENFPPFKIDSDITKLLNLNEYGISEQLSSTINSRYLTVSEFAATTLNPHDLVLLHSNIRLLSLHCDELVSLVASLDKNSDVVAVWEIWEQSLF